MTISKYHRIFTFSTLFFMITLVVLLFLQAIAMRSIERSQRLQVNAMMLSNEILQNSSVLTQRARDYIVTGDTASLSSYYNVLDVKNGVVPRPDGRKISYEQLLTELKLSKDEIDLINQSEKRLNNLSALEIKAFALYQNNLPSLKEESSAMSARELLFGTDYNAYNQQIIVSINEFNRVLNQRVTAEIKAEQYIQEVCTYLSCLVLMLFLSLIFAFILFVRQRVMKPLYVGTEVASTIEKGDYSSRWLLDTQDELGELAKTFNRMLDAIETNDRELKLSMKNTLQLNAQLSSQNLALNETAIVSVTDVKGTILRANKLFSEVSQFSMDEIVGANHRIVNSGYHSKEFWQEMYKSLANGDTWRADVKNKAKDGSIYWVDSIMVPIFYDQETPQEYLAVRFLITEKKLIEKALKNSQQQLQTIFETLPVGIILIAPDGKIMASNTVTEKILGISADEHKMRKLQSKEWIIVREDDSPMPVEEYPASRVLNGEELVKDVVMGVYRPDGTMVWINTSAAQISGQDDLGVVVSIEDVTARVQARDIILRKEQKAAILKDFAIESSNVKDIADILQVALNYILKYTGWDVGYVYNYKNNRLLSDDIWSFNANNDFVQLKEITEKITFEFGEDLSGQVLKSKNIVWIEEMTKGANFLRSEKGDIKFLGAFAFPVIVNDTVQFVLEVFSKKPQPEDSDIFDFISQIQIQLDNAVKKKKMNDEISYINMLSDKALELTNAGFWHVDFSLNDTFECSDRAAKIFGMVKKDNNLYPISEWFSNVEKGDAKIAELVREQFSGTVEGRYDIYNIEYPFYSPIHDKVVWVRALGHVIRDNTGKTLHMYGVVQNIHEAKLNQLALADAKKEAELATEAKSSFLANMSHEIRTPMNAIIGLSNLIKKTELSEKQDDYIKKIESSSKSLLGIINDILDFSKIEAGKLTIDKTDFNLEDVFQDLANVITYKAHEKGLEIVFGIDSKVPCYLNGDPLRLGQVLINLSNNAVKFTAEGEIVICANLVSENEDKVVIKFTVKDSGIGIEQQKIAKLFDSFTQADTSTSRKFGGTGLGLTISKNLVELMNGEISVESDFGKGSEFIFTVELEKQQYANKKLLPTSDLRGLKVLVVDDNESSRVILKNALESFTFQVTTVDSGEKAIELLNNSTNTAFELILMDWHMPEMDGLIASKLILENKKILKKPLIIMMTAYGRDEMYTEAEELGLTSILIKPVRYSDLFDTIMNSFGKFVQIAASMKNELDEKSVELDSIRGAQILLAEDNLINQQVATELLECAGFKITVANNGLEVLEHLKKQSFDIVLMDLQMPEMNGYEATELIRKEPKFKNLPIVAMTADAMGGVKEKCLGIGMNDFVTKPIAPSKLFAALIKWVKSGNRGLKQTKTVDQEVFFIPVIEGINTEDGLARVAGNKKLYLKLLRDFTTSSVGMIDEVVESLQKNDEEKASRLIHTLKGTSGNLGMSHVYNVTMALEKEIIEEGWDNFELKSLILKNELINLVEKLQENQLNQENKNLTSTEIKPEKLLLLKGLLENNDPDAIEFFDSMGRLSHPLFDNLKEKIKGYEFDEALDILLKM